MARVYKRPRAARFGGGHYEHWYLEYRDERGIQRRERTLTRNRRDAELLLAERRAEVEAKKRDPFRDRGDGAQLLDVFVGEYLEKVGPTLRELVQRKLRLRYWTEYFGPKARLRDVTQERIEGYKAERLSLGRAPATVNREVLAIRAALQKAVEWKRIPFNAASGVKSEAEENARDRVLSADEAAALVAAARSSENPALPALLVLAMNTGGRLGELLGLRWDDVDASRGVVRFTRTKGKRQRSVPVEPWVLAELQAVRGASEWVFRTLDGRQLRDVRRSFHLARDRAGLGPDVVFHAMRHTFVTRLAEQGVSASLIQQLTGHADLAMVQRYTHPSEPALRQAVAGLSLGRPDLRAVEGEQRVQNADK